MLTVKELKEHLKRFPDDANVITRVFLDTGIVELVVIDEAVVLGAVAMSKEEEIDATLHRTIWEQQAVHQKHE